MDYLRVGKYVATHGLKGEMKIISDVEKAERLLLVGNIIYLGEKKEPFKINSYRKHQKYDMVTLESLNTIESVLPYKGCFVYLNKEDIEPSFFNSVIGYQVYNNDKNIGQILEILKGIKYDMIVVSEKRVIIPFIEEFIIEIDHDNKIIKTNYMI